MDSGKNFCVAAQLLGYIVIVNDLLHLLQNTFDRKRISANTSTNPNPHNSRRSNVSGDARF